MTSQFGRAERVHRPRRKARRERSHHKLVLLSPALFGRRAENQTSEGKGAGEFAVHFGSGHGASL